MRFQTFTFLSLLSTSFANGSPPLDLALTPANYEIAHIIDLPPLNDTQSLSPPPSDDDDPANLDPSLELLKRDQGPCPNGFNSCSTLAVAFVNVCCATTAVCSADNVGNVACCPLGSFCTGTINPNTATSGGTGVGVTSATTTGTGLVVPGTSNTALATATGAISYVPNSYFPFPIIASNFAEQASCLSAYSACSTNYAVCSADLAGGGGGFGVTIQAPGGGGVTVAAVTTANLGPASASSICSSLSSQACHGLQLTNCGVTASTTGVTVVTGDGTRTASWPKRDIGGAMIWSCLAVGLGALVLIL